mmetsp:Transcript_13507/g.31984  ORF Transcript_13507/g.31984 Transcript_13507/m.31984 type:complete len:358 (-) Transcript_13507:273-1346(-)
MRVSVEHELPGKGLREEAEELRGPRREPREHVGRPRAAEGGAVPRQELAELADEAVHVREELDEPLGDEDDPVVEAALAPRRDHVRDLRRDRLQGDAVLADLLADEAHLRVRLEGDLERDVAGRPPHEPHKVVVLVGRRRVHHEVPHELAVDAAGGVEAEAHGDPPALEVPVDGLGHADDPRADPRVEEVLREDRRVGVGVVPADDHEPVQRQRPDHPRRLLELGRRLDLVPPRADDVEAALVAERPHRVRSDERSVAPENPGGAPPEPEELRAGVVPLEEVEQAGDDVVAAGCLAAGEHDADSEGGSQLGRTAARPEGHPVRPCQRRKQGGNPAVGLGLTSAVVRLSVESTVEYAR